MTLILTM